MEIKSYKYRLKNENGFIALTVLIVTVLCMIFAGYIVANARAQIAHTRQTEQTLHADLLAQDAIEIAKQKLSIDTKWRGNSEWILRHDGSCQFLVQDHPDFPLPDTMKLTDPDGVMITGVGKDTEGSFQKRVIWYDPTTSKIYMYMHD